jgi:leader peptidase (prepilin peptidase) / N-methyltransferase
VAVLIFILGSIIGSFFNVCIYRIPRDESISYPPSHCTVCTHRLMPLDMVPILSYIFLKGRCRYCGEHISIQYPLVEALTGGLYLALYLKFGIGIELLFYGILISILIIISVIDIHHAIIPPSLIIIGMVSAVIFNLIGWGRPFLDSIYGCLAGAGVILLMDILSLLLFKKQGMGGGDVKLMGMVGLFMGLRYVLLSILFSIYIGGITFLILIIAGKIKKGSYIPFGPFLSLGTLVSLFLGAQIIMWYTSKFF